MAEHINKIKERNYVQTRTRVGGRGRGVNDDDGGGDAPADPGGGRGRGRGRGRGGRGRGAAAAGRRGRGGWRSSSDDARVALIEGTRASSSRRGLSKPFLRKEVVRPGNAACIGFADGAQWSCR